MNWGQLGRAALFCCIAAAIVAAAWYWFRPQTDEGEVTDPEGSVVPPLPSVVSAPRADDPLVPSSASWRRVVVADGEDEESEEGPADGGFHNADVHDESATVGTPFHIREFLDADSPEESVATPGTSAVHVGEFLDADSD